MSRFKKQISAERMENIGVDKISKLPELIIHQIMSHLSRKERARTRLLSKTWCGLEKNYPVLHFDFDCVVRNLRRKKISKKSLLKSLETYRKHVFNSLSRFNQEKLCLQAVSVSNIRNSYLKLPSDDLDSWIRLALENGVKNLEFNLPDSNKYVYNLPKPVFYSKTLTILQLQGCSLDHPLSMFSSLKKLALANCSINGPISFKNADCPVLEVFVLNFCSGFNSVHISNLLRLKNVEVSLCKDDADVEELVISSRSIQNLTIDVRNKRWSVLNIDGCDSLKSLQLQSTEITDEELRSLLSELPFLEELYLVQCNAIRTIRISSPCIRTLEVYPGDDGDLKNIKIATPSLNSFIFISKKKSCFINVADCCRGLDTLMLFSTAVTDTTFHELTSQFPLLKNLWIIGCRKLRRIKVPNLQLKTLHIVRCNKLEVVKVDSCNLSELFCTGHHAPAFSLADHMYTGDGLSIECESNTFWSSRLKEILRNMVGNESVVKKIFKFIPVYPKDYLNDLQTD